MNLVSLLLVVAVLVIKVDGQRNFVISFDYIGCKHNPEYLKSSNCSLDKSQDPPHANMDFPLRQEVKNPTFALKLTLQYKQIVRTFLNLKDQSCCDLLVKKPSISLVSIVRDILKKHGELPKRCPVKKDFRFLFKDLAPSAERFPGFLPDGNFTMKLTFDCEKNFCLNVEMRGFIKRK